MPNDPFFKDVEVTGNNAATRARLDQEKAQEILTVQKEQRAVERGRVNLENDFESGKSLGQDIVGDGLGRLEGNARVESSREQLRSLTEGPTSAENTARREAGLEDINAQTQSSSRQALSRLSTAGVKGGVAATALGDIANQGILARRGLERDIIADQSAQSRAAIGQLAEFETENAKFDLAQIAAEKNIEVQTGLASASLGAVERGTLRATEAQTLAAQQQGSGGKK